MRWLAGGMMAAAALAGAAPASAGVYSDDLSKCLVRKTSEADGVLLMQWLFSALSAGPAVSGIASVTPAQRTDFHRKAARLFERLLVDDCHAESVAALKYEGPSSIETSFRLLGEVASRGLMSDPKVQKEMEALGAEMDLARLEALYAEAGLAPAQPAPPR